MSGGRYLACWFAVISGSGNIYVQQWELAAGCFGMLFLLLADALISAVKEAGKK